MHSDKLMHMRGLRLLGITLFAISVPLFLVTTNVRGVINAPLLYSYGFDKYDISARTGIELDELLLASAQIREYFNSDEEDLDVKVVQGGLRRSIFNTREVSHMRDVKGLVRGVYRVQELAGVYLVAFSFAGLAMARRRFLRQLGRYVGLGGVGTVGLVVVVGLASIVGFDRLFLTFHLVSFSNDLWQLDPSRDYLIAMFPEGFFFTATIWIAVSTLLEALALALVPAYFLWWRRVRGEAQGPALEPQGRGGPEHVEGAPVGT